MERLALSTATPQVRAEAARIVTSLRRRTGAIGDAMVAAIQAEIPPYANASPAVIEDVRAHCVAHARLTFEVAGGDRTPLRGELEFAREAAARRVRQGIPLDSLLQAFRVGHRTVWEAIVSEAGATAPGRDAAIALAHPVMEYIDVASTQVAEAYLKEEQQLVLTADRERRDLLERLLEGRLPAPGERLAATELDPDGTYVVAIARDCGPAPRDRHALHHVADTVADHAAAGAVQPLVVVRQREVVGVLPGGTGDDGDPVRALRRAAAAVVERRGIDVRVGLSTACAGFRGVAHAYEEARQALQRTSPERPVVAMTEMSPFQYLVASADAGTRRAVAGKGTLLLRFDREGTASETVLAYAAADLSIRRTAERLCVHPNTVRYRLRRIFDITGLDVRSFEGLMDMVTVIRVASEERARRPSG
jgi:hypothetical protein